MTKTVLVVGAGIAGLTAARTLEARGHRVTVVERGRVPGGRMATRRVLDGDADRADLASLAFDHGAQYFTVRDPRFGAAVEGWHKDRLVLPWHGKLAAFDSEGREPVDDEIARWVGVPAMSAICQQLARGLDLRCGVRIVGLTRPGDVWLATPREGEPLGPYDAVVISAPAPQAATLLASTPALARAALAVPMHPCWAALVAFEDVVATRFDAAFVTSSPLAWIARDRSKPRRGQAETWVLHASGAWSTAHADDEADAVGPFLLNAFADLVRAGLPRPAYLAAHRWRHACAELPSNAGVLVDRERSLAVCGDWCGGGRIEGAYLSGLAAGELF